MKINKELIKLLIKKKSLKQKDVASQIGVNPQDFNNWMFRGIFPHYNKLEELADLLEEDVSKLYTANSVLEPLSIYGKNMVFTPDELIPLYEVDPHLGLTALWSNNGNEEPKDHLYLPGIKADLALTYYGKGLEPQLETGDWIVLRKVSDLSFFNFGHIHVVTTKEHVIVRHLQKSKEDHILLSTTNGETDSIELAQKAIKTLFIVVTIIKRNII